MCFLRKIVNEVVDNIIEENTKLKRTRLTSRRLHFV